MVEFEINGRKIGQDQPPYVIAEVGINHEGDVEKAIQCVDKAADAGAEVIKFQCHITEKEMIHTDMKPGEISDEALFDIIKRCELNEHEEIRVKDYANSKGLVYLSTPFSREASDRLDDMDVPAFKIGSGECNNLPLIEHIARKGKPMIISTGMNDMESIQKTVNLVRRYDTPLALMHCTSMYPTPYNKVRLGAITQMINAFPGVPIGLSDHSINIYTCLGAVSLGACLLEKHFTVSRKWPGPDVPISIEPNELHHLVNGSRSVWEALNGEKNILPEEQPVIDFAYASVVSIKKISKGDELNLNNIWVKRPGNGEIPAADLNECLGKLANRDIAEGEQLRKKDLSA